MITEEIDRVCKICAIILLDHPNLFTISDLVRRSFPNVPHLHQSIIETRVGLRYVVKIKWNHYWELFSIDLKNGSSSRKSLLKSILSEYLPSSFLDRDEQMEWNNLDFSKYPDAVNFIG